MGLNSEDCQSMAKLFGFKVLAPKWACGEAISYLECSYKNSKNTFKLEQPKKWSINAISILSQFKSMFKVMSGATAVARRTRENFYSKHVSQVRSAVKAIKEDRMKTLIMLVG
jgi:hypothetical protein